LLDMPANRKPLSYETTFNTYTEMGPLGEGGAGRVYAVNDGDGQRFALKILRAASTAQRKRFKNEIAFCSKKPSPHIVSVIDDGFVGIGEERLPFYVMPLYGGTLRTLLGAGLPGDRVLPYFAQILDGVEAAHILDVVHRDLKPENILHDPASDALVIADFGIARFTEEALFTAVETRAQDRLANFLYAAPEQRVRGREVGPRADVYALGLILNEMFTGEVLQGSGHKLIGSVTPEYAYLDALVDLMVRQSPDDRPSSIAAIKRELIARGNDFVSQQRLDRLRSTVIRESEIDDPLIADPIRPVRVDYSDDGRLDFELSQVPTPQWVRAFVSQGSYAAVMGSDPSRFGFLENHALVPVNGGQAGAIQMVANHFRNYVRAANALYEAGVRDAQRRAQEDQREALRRQTELEERRQRVRETVKSIKF
jgi:serine/threonine protein kinase